MASESSHYNFRIHTYGCKVNTYDTGLLEKRLSARGHRVLADLAAPMSGAEAGAPALGDGAAPSRDALDPRPRVHILNTCAVTGEATREAIKQVRRIKSRDPLSTVVVTGCAAQVDGKMLDGLPGADLVVANSHKGDLENILDRYFKGDRAQKVFRSNIFRKEDLEAGGGTEAGHTRTFLKIQDGCNSFCTYCVIPYARGKSRSIPVAELVSRIRDLHAAGSQEVVLTGVHIGDYEDEVRGARQDLASLVRAVLEKTLVPRVRLTSLEPVELTPQLMELFADERLCAHFHMSIQSANGRVLGAMKRQYTARDVEWSLNEIHRRVPNAFVGMDVIVGFPGETDEEFEDTYLRLADLPWTRAHVFPYSERPGTRAALLEGPVPRERRLLRSARLRELSTARYGESARRQIGSLKKVLILGKPARGAEGLSRDYWTVSFDKAGLPAEAAGLEAERICREKGGREVVMRVTGYDDSHASRMEGHLLGVEAEG